MRRFAAKKKKEKNLAMWVLLVLLAAAVLLLWYRSQFRRPVMLPRPDRAVVKKQSPRSSRKELPETWRVVVLGGAGNLGQMLVRVLLSDEYAARVDSIAVFDMRPGLIQDKRLRYVIGDLTNASDVSKAVDGAHVVFHLASLIDLRSSDRHWPLLHNVNVIGTHNVVEACIRANVNALVYTGSLAGRKDTPGPKMRAAVRVETNASTGENNIFDVDPDETCSLYGKSKNLGERAIISANARDGSNLRTAAVLPCQIFGFGDRFQYDMMLPNLKSATPTPGVMRIDSDESGIGSFSWNESCADLHVKCAIALMDAERRDSVGGCSFYSVDFDEDNNQFAVDADAALAKASHGAWKARNPLHKVIPRPLVHVLGAVASIIDWFYDAQVSGHFYQLAFLEQIQTYSIGDLRCSSAAAIEKLGFKPVSAKKCHEIVAKQYAERELGI